LDRENEDARYALICGVFVIIGIIAVSTVF